MNNDIQRRLVKKLNNRNMLPYTVIPKQENLVSLQESEVPELPEYYEKPTILETIINDDAKLSMFLLFGISMFALYLLLKRDSKCPK